MAANTPMMITPNVQDALIQFYKQCCQQTNQQWNLRESLRRVDLSYYREVDWTSENIRAKVSNIYGDPTRLQNIIMPIVAPAVEAAVAYQTSVFLTGYPIFSVASDADNMDAANQMNTVMEDQGERGAWARQFMLWFRDGFKYNLSYIEASWEDEITAALETDIKFSGGKEGKPKEVIWSGNKIKRLDPYNTFADTRVEPSKIYCDGEYAGYVDLISRVQLKVLLARLPSRMNVTKAFESGVGAAVGGYGPGGMSNFYIPQINPWSFLNGLNVNSMDWLAWASVGTTGNGTNRIAYKNMYEVSVFYGKIIPSDFGMSVPASNTPQIWKFVIVNHQVIVYAERQTNAHGYIPIFCGQPLEDGLRYQTKSLAQNTDPFQAVNSALMSSVIASRRRAISDRALYDPSKIDSAHINNPNPSAKIPVRPSAYGKPLSEAVYHFPFNDDQLQPTMAVMQMVSQQSNTMTGQNASKQGQFTKGNKTLHEYADVMAHANAPDQMVSILYENQVFTPLKVVLKTNILQYQGGVSLYSTQQQKVVQIDPVALRTAVSKFKVSDGLIPQDKMLGTDAFQAATQMFMSAPQLAAGYNISKMVSYLFKTQGADLTEFELPQAQSAYNQAVSQWQQMIQTTIQEFMTSISMKGLSIQDQNTLIQAMQKALPPQPTPDQFGWDPSANAGNQPVQTQDNQQQPQTPLQSMLQGNVANG